MAETQIEWTERTINLWTGCTKVAAPCAHCYIPNTMPFRAAGRRFVNGHIPLLFHMHRLEQLFRRRTPTMYFVNSLSDTFHEDVPDGCIAWLWWVMAQCPQHTFQILTKRPERMRDFVTRWADNLERDEHGEPVALDFVGARGPDAIRAAHKCGRALLFADMLEQWGEPPDGAAYPTYDWMEGIGRYPAVHDNIWLGVTIGNRRSVQWADILRDTPAAVRFISAEPLLGPLLPDGEYESDQDSTWRLWADDFTDHDGLNLRAIDWLIAGGESGPGARRCDEAWLRDLRDACAHSGTAFFLKQMGTHLARQRGVKGKGGGEDATLDGRIHHEMPQQGTLL